MDSAQQRATAASERTIIAATVAILLAVWAIVGVALYQARETALAEARSTGANLTAALSNDVAHTLDRVSAIMERLAERMRQHEGVDIYGWARELPLNSDGIVQAALVGPDSRLVNSTIEPNAEPIDLSDRPHIRVHLDRKTDDIFVGPPLVGRLSHSLTIQLSKRVDGNDGRTLGVLVFSLEPRAFSNLYRKVDLGERGVLAITGSDGVVRARFSKSSPEGLDGVGESVAAGPHPTDRSGDTAESYVRESLLNHVTRVYTFRAVARYPLEVTVGLDAAEVFASYRQNSTIIVALTAVATLALCGFAIYLIQLGRATARHQAELASEQAKVREAESERERAEAASQAKSLFLTNMSHELRTPLNAIIGFSEIIKDQALGPSARKNYADYAKDIHSSGHHLLGLINDILDLAKIDAGQMSLEEEPLDLADLVRHGLSLLEPRYRSKNVTVEMDIPRDLPFIRADGQKLRRALLNLLGNAVKFNRDHGRVTIRTKATADAGLSVEIADTGIGMTPEEIAMAFEAFVQVDNSLARRYEGTGIGLPLTKRLIELHGGTIAIESVKEAGTTVILGFPAGRIIPRESALRSQVRSSAAA
jgi:signal transduction histidine kinase